ncbi:hypothetical protein ABXW19_12515, partial [Streptococcus suis]|uniref:hypothetical protein n=1 Tax=Streptococcus suis TaxID=1307 RepID=UPI003CF8C06E
VGLIFAVAFDPQVRATAEHYFAQVTQHVRTRFEALIGNPEFARHGQSAEATIELLKILDMLEGLAAAV